METLTIAMAKGRTTNRALEILSRMGIRFSVHPEDSRKLVFTDDTGTIKLLQVKAVDVPTYVEKGAADLGIVGKDIVMEDVPNVYELADLDIGKCKIAVAGFPQTMLCNNTTLTVATKYPNVAKAYFDQKGFRTDIIKLNGSIELAPLIGLADVIVDIVETGTTLKENGLVILEEIGDISARLIVNKASYAIKTASIRQFIDSMNAEVKLQS
ncbi:ATP phosphoribosyltransferase [Sporosarcina sp. Te-1]|uniref:ATP phosphoribosyltransferase n=1 Tax=Sporosarcina sp. Te-1 TaxID=2818390 RepID=UPI001A9DAE0E|nr:ATP phosphoribosyltransferase [Sporosarcina sp. Te-1]QTD41304.1 ATP phosphoribosyltransferase [Sporosarcina sp. Te-1]